MIKDNMMSKTLVVLYAASLPLSDFNPITMYKIPMVRKTIPNNKKGKYQNINDWSARFNDSNIYMFEYVYIGTKSVLTVIMFQ